MQQPARAGGGAGSQYISQILGIPSGDHMTPPSPPIIQSKHGQPEVASPISARLPAVRNFEEHLPPVAVAGFPDEDALAGEEAERGPHGNRWPRQETVALLKIRSDMDANFRDSTLKGPLWEEVSRKLGELGYNRSAKKCKEKFENVHKYYKRTKEGRAGRQDGKSYRFFSQLEALHTAGSSGGGIPMTLSPTTYQSPLPATPISVGSPMVAPSRIQIATTLPPPIPSQFPPPPVVLPEGMSFSTSESESEEESEEEEGTEAGGRKRKRAGGGGSSSKKIMGFFERLVKQVMERQEAMQQRFLETIEKREQDRMIRDEAWKRQEMARLTREHELMAQERAMAASRDAAVIGFLQKITGQTIPTSTTPTITTSTPPQPTPSSITPLSHPSHTINFQQPTHEMMATPVKRQPLPTSTSAVDALLEKERQVESAKVTTTAGAEMTMTGSFDPASSSRWPKAEVHALIKIRSGMEGKYQEAGPKGPLWEDISAEMRRVGYNRSSKRCKEKWENINKYFKKVKESNKKRPEDAKTCPYFHQLDALYKKKHIAGAGAGTSSGELRHDVSSIMSPPLPDSGAKDDENNDLSSNNSIKACADGGSNANARSNLQVQTTNGDLTPSFFQGEGAIKKPEDIMKELMEHHQQQSVMDDYDSDNLDDVEDDEDNDGDDDRENDEEKMDYNIQFQRPGSSNGGAPGASPATTSASSFLHAMVK